MIELLPHHFDSGNQGEHVHLFLHRMVNDKAPPVLLLHGASAQSTSFLIPGPELDDYRGLLKQGLWRPTSLELFVMDRDGGNLRQVTGLGGANFAPSWHPDGKRLIFASNKHDAKGRNFDIYLINVDGTGLERITFNDTFDGFPMFSPDGKKLVFASNRGAKAAGETNVFVANWVDGGLPD